jgi:hypothetical protein
LGHGSYKKILYSGTQHGTAVLPLEILQDLLPKIKNLFVVPFSTVAPMIAFLKFLIFNF